MADKILDQVVNNLLEEVAKVVTSEPLDMEASVETEVACHPHTQDIMLEKEPPIVSTAVENMEIMMMETLDNQQLNEDAASELAAIDFSSPTAEDVVWEMLTFRSHRRRTSTLMPAEHACFCLLFQMC